MRAQQMKTNGQKLPFRVSRELPESLTRQLVDGFVRAIELGVYKPGDMLPPLREIVEETGVSKIIARVAIRRLGEMGYVNPRLGVGTIVLDRNSLWKGQVLIVCFDTISDYFHDTINGILRANLLKAGYLPLQVSVVKNARGQVELDPLKIVLRQHFSLVVINGSNPRVVKCVQERGIPFVCDAAGCDAKSGACGRFRMETDGAFAAFAAQCRASGIRRVFEIRFRARQTGSSPLCDAGIEVEDCVLPLPKGFVVYSDLQKNAFREFERQIFGGHRELPDLIYTTDDYMASAVLHSLRSHGVRIPKDVKFVTWINRGTGPFTPGEFARIEADPFLFGKQLSDYVLALMEGRAVPEVLSLRCAFKPGDTFPVRG